MKRKSSIFNIVMIVSLLIPTVAIAAEIEYSHPNDSFTPCGIEKSKKDINPLPSPHETLIGEVTYVSGGICVDGVRQMKSLAKNFPLEIVLVEKMDGKEVYLADVNINIFDAKEKLVLNVSTEGPFLLAKLPNGVYQITAEFNAVMKTKRVMINKNKHTRIVFLWAATDNSS